MTASDTLKERKRALRARVRALRDAMPPEERAAASRRIVERLTALREVEDARTVMLFSSFGSEVLTSGAIEQLVARGVRVVLPRVEGRDIVGVAHRPGDPVRKARFGADEPISDEAVDPQEIDVVVVPGLAFDRRGYRVGYGGGFFDRFLDRTRPDALKVAVAFGSQIVDEVPHGEADVPVAAIVTEREVVRCR